MTLFDDPLALRNIKGGLAHLMRWHSRRNSNHPLRIEERRAAEEWWRARQQPTIPPVETGPRTKPYPKPRVKKPVPVPDADGKFRL